MEKTSLVEEARRYRQLGSLFALFGYHHVFRWAGTVIDPEVGVVDHRVGQLLAQRTLNMLQMQVETEGLHRLEGLGRYAVASNHASYLDWALLLGYFPSPLRFVAKRELSRVPFVGGFLKKRGVLIDRRRGQDAKTALKQALADGQPWPIMLFPEGTRTPDGRLQPFKRGGLRILLEAGLPVVPVCLSGTYEAFPRHGRSIKTGARLTMQVLAPVEPRDYPDKELGIDAVESRIRAAYIAAAAPPGA